MNFVNALGHHKNIRHENFVHMFLMSLDKYFKLLSKQSSLPSPNGELSCVIPSSSIAAANQEVSKVLPTISAPVTRGNYAKFIPKQKQLLEIMLCYMVPVMYCAISRQNFQN